MKYCGQSCVLTKCDLWSYSLIVVGRLVLFHIPRILLITMQWKDLIIWLLAAVDLKARLARLCEYMHVEK